MRGTYSGGAGEVAPQTIGKGVASSMVPFAPATRQISRATGHVSDAKQETLMGIALSVLGQGEDKINAFGKEAGEKSLNNTVGALTGGTAWIVEPKSPSGEALLYNISLRSGWLPGVPNDSRLYSDRNTDKMRHLTPEEKKTFLIKRGQALEEFVSKKKFVQNLKFDEDTTPEKLRRIMSAASSGFGKKVLAEMGLRPVEPK